MSVSKEQNQETSAAVEMQPVEEERWRPMKHIEDFFKVYRPPFTMTLDALFCVAWCPVDDLKKLFPALPFLSLLGKTPLVLWFARFKDFDYTDAAGTAQKMSNTPGALPYQELGIGTLLWRRGFFVPSLYASSDFGTQLGLSYGMPKQPTLPIELQITQKSMQANLKQCRRQSFIWSRFLGSGRLLARIARRFLPLRTWPITFPSDKTMQAGISGVDRMRVASIQSGRLVMDTAWFSGECAFFPFGLYLDDMRLELPA